MRSGSSRLPPASTSSCTGSTARFWPRRCSRLTPRRRTPAIRLKDGVDYDPTNKWVLFGHHFAAIAGAGPLIGPMLAAQFGYLPGFLWILIGAALAGAVHDMVILTASVRRNGRSLAQIARDEIGPVGGLAAAIAVIFIIIVALAGLGLAVVNALKANPWGAYTIFMTIPIALLMGVYLKKLRPGKVAEVSMIGVPLLLAAVATGHFIPGSFLAPLFDHPDKFMVVALALYGFIASVLPVWMLLCPRDYLSTYMKIGTILLLALGVIFMAPMIRMPARHAVRPRRRADHSGPAVSLHVHHHRLRRDLGVPCAHRLGNNAEDDHVGEGNSAHRLRRDAGGRVRFHDGAHCRHDPYSRRLLRDQQHAQFRAIWPRSGFRSTGSRSFRHSLVSMLSTARAARSRLRWACRRYCQAFPA